MPLDRSLLSVVVPVYNEAANLRELERRLDRVLGQLDFRRCEVLLVSDGSTDESDAIIASIVRKSPCYQAIFLSRNFGHQAAVSIGLSHARGSVVAILDGDLQDPPEVLVDLVGGLDEGADVAYAVRRHRKESMLKTLAYFFYYRLLARVASINIPPDSGDFCCLRRNVVDALLALPERNRFVRGLRAWVGYRQVGVEYERAARFAGRPKYGLRKLLGLAYDGLFSFSSLPVRLMQLLGFLISALAMLTAVGYTVWYFAAPERFRGAPGFATLVISIWFIGGVQLLFLGLVSEYVYRTFDESRGRPIGLVRQVITHSELQSKSRSTCSSPTGSATPNYTAGIGGGGPAKPSSST